MKLLYFPEDKTTFGELLYDPRSYVGVIIAQLSGTNSASLMVVRLSGDENPLENNLGLKEGSATTFYPRREDFLSLVASILVYHIRDRNGDLPIPAEPLSRMPRPEMQSH